MALLSIVLISVAALVFYLGHPQQRFRPVPLSRQQTLAGGLFSLVAGLLAGAAVFSSLTLVFVCLITLMTVWGLLPLLSLLPALPSYRPAPRGRSAGTSRPEPAPLGLQPDWWQKSLVGLVGGYLLSVALVGVFAWAGPGGISAVGKVQFNMWLITPLWLLLFSLVYLIPTGKQALKWLLIANLVVWQILTIIRGMAG
ncbi:MAG: hypothetical protein OIF57_14805 [Marinobacterium sp.]|nr:hypothetical protein [Marinobacterium sp.]